MAAAPAKGQQEPVVDDDDDLEEEEVEEEEIDPADEEFGKNFDPKRARKTILDQRAAEKKLKADLRAAKKDRDALDKRLKDLENKDKPANEKLEQDAKDASERAEKAEKALTKATVRTEALETATRLKFRNPTLAYKLLDHDDIEFDDDGDPTNVEELLRAALKDDPYLAGRRLRAVDEEEEEDDDVNAGTGRRKKASAGFDMNAAIRAGAGH